MSTNTKERATTTEDLQSERVVISAAMRSEEALYMAAEVLTPESFSDFNHAEIWRIILSLTDRNLSVGVFALIGECEKLAAAKGRHSLMRSLELCQKTHNQNYDSAILSVREAAIKRRLATMVQGVASIIGDPLTQSADALEYLDRESLQAVSMATGTKSPVSWKDGVKEFRSHLDGVIERANESGLTGVTTGISKLDGLTTGWQAGDLYIIAGRPSMGKTALAVSMALSAVQSGVPTLFFSLEMSKAQLMMRFASILAEVPLQPIRTGKLTPNDNAKLHEALAIDLPLTIDDTAETTVRSIKAKATIYKRKQGLGLVIVDYLQLLSGDRRAESREQEVSRISRSLKVLAKELDVPILCLSQLNRSAENRAEKKPLLSDLRESGAIEQDADAVIFCHRPEYYNITHTEENELTKDRGWLLIAKQRQGPTDNVMCSFNKGLARWGNAFDITEEFNNAIDW